LFPSPLAVLSDVGRLYGTGVEARIEEAYRLCFRAEIIDGQVMNLRLPFAQNHERETLAGSQWEAVEKGKGDPASLWLAAEEALASEDFRRYTEALNGRRETIVIFDIASQSWSLSRDMYEISRLRAGAYVQTPHKPHVLVNGRGARVEDVYNYLYCVARVGIDCSGFVWQALSYTAEKAGVDLAARLSRAMGAPSGQGAYYAGTSFYNSGSGELEAVADAVGNLRAGDIMLFCDEEGEAIHSALIQSVDLAAGRIRYLQSTDEAPAEERGVHESFISFDPSHPELSLQDPSLIWSQQRRPPFQGESESPYTDDGQRFRAYGGNGRVVRLKLMAEVAEALAPEAPAEDLGGL
jgi:cell wall-associated NlpC family hydrolase